MSGHNAGLCMTDNQSVSDAVNECGDDYRDKTKNAAIKKGESVAGSYSYYCKKPCDGENRIFFGSLKGEYNSYGPVKYCTDTIYGGFELNSNATCKGNGYGIVFQETNDAEVLFADLAKCVLCNNYTPKPYALAHNDEKHKNTVFAAYQLNECVDCSYANFKGYYVVNNQTCKKCPEGYGFDESHGIILNQAGIQIDSRCGRCIADGYGYVENHCASCADNKVSLERYESNGTRSYNECILHTDCTYDGYGISADNKACKKCADDEESVVDNSGVRRCVSNACTGGVAQQYDSPYSIANVQSGPDKGKYTQIHKAIHECKSGGNKRYELIDCTDGQKAIYFKKVDNVIYKFCVNKSEVEGTGFAAYGVTYTTSNGSTISYYRAFCNTQTNSNKGVYWEGDTLKCYPSKPSEEYKYLLTSSDSSEELYRTYEINEWVKCDVAGYGVEGDTKCKKCGFGQASYKEEGLDEPYACVQCANSDIIEDGFCKKCDGNTVPNSARTQCEACSNNSVAKSDNTACVSCPDNSSAQSNGTCKCNNGFKKMPGAYFVTNPLDFICKEECDDEYASVYYDENSKNRVEYDVCTKCKETANHKYYHAHYWKYDTSSDDRSYSICRAECDTANGYGKQSADSFTCIKCSEYKADGTKITESNYTGDTLVLKNGVCSTGCDKYQVKHNGECKYCYEIDESQKIYDQGANVSETDEARCILSSNCKFEQGNNKPKFIEKYYKSGNRTVKVGKPDNEPVKNQNFPDAEGKKMYLCGSCAENQDIDKNTANVSVICHACNNKKGWYDVNGGVGERCKNCPNNFMCNGVDKKACPFGFVSDNGGNFTCKANGSATNGTGLVKKTSNTAFDIVEYSSFLTEEEIYYNDYVKNNNTDSIEQYAYDSCNTENAAYIKVENYSVKNITEYESWASSGHISFADISVYACKSCATGEKASGDKCVCGKGEEFKTYGLMGSKCIVCPNGREGNNDQESQSWRCKTCPEGFGYNETKESCDKCLKDNPSYAGKCMSFQELQESEGNGAHAFYPTLVSDNAYKWGSCPNVINNKGVCCYGGKSYVCALGTISKAGGICGNGDRISNPVRDLGSCPIKCTITGKTTTTKSTGTYYKNDASVIREQAIADQLCTEYREPTRFCPWGLGNIVNGKYEGAYDSSNPQHSQCFKFTPEILEAVYGFPKVDYTKDVPANLPDNGTDE